MARVGLVALVSIAAGVLAVPSHGAHPNGPITVTDLRTERAENPLGIDSERPLLSWVLESSERAQAQVAYKIQVATSPELLRADRPDVWDSDRVRSSDSTGVAYDGPPLESATRYHWRVRAWDADNHPSRWSEPAWWETGLLGSDGWDGASWIGSQAAEDTARRVSLDVGAQQARFLRFEVTELGDAARGEGFPQPVHRLQLAEVEVVDTASGTELASGRAVTASESLEVAGAWSTSYLTDGQRDSNSNPRGYSSEHRFDPDVSDEPIWLEVDLGEVVRFDEVRLYSRTDATSFDDGTANFPVDYTLATRDTEQDDPALIHEVSGQEPPTLPGTEPLPLLARDFAVDGELEEARLYLSGLGLHEARLNGAKVGDAVLEPGETDYRDTVQYSTYDVTDELVRGENTVGVMLGNGIYNVPSTPGRYQKLAESMGPPRAIGKLRLEYADGSVETIATDASWRVGDAPITFSGWYGGEDHDARLEQPGWDEPGFDRSAWRPASVLEGPGGELRGRRDPPIEVVEEIPAVSVEEVADGVHLVDFGKNFAGWPELTASGPNGTEIELWPAEQLGEDGRISQNSTGGPIWSTYTLAGRDRPETWHPRFSYHGFRYLEVRGYPGEPRAEDFRGLVLRAANDRIGSFESGDELLNEIDTIIDRSVQSNMYSTLTDCPHREKLGWLEVSHLMFGSISSAYDVGAWYEKLFDDMREAQLPSGMVPSIAPEFTVFSGAFRDDPNWGGAYVIGPWQHYQEFGDAAVLREHLDGMRAYVDYLGSRASGHLLSHGLGDWGAIDTSTPVPLIATASYFRQASTVARAAEVLGEDAIAVEYADLAAEIREAFTAEFFDPESVRYGSGSQASYAIPLHAGLVPEERVSDAVAGLVDAFEAADGHVTTGEVGLRPVLQTLTEHGHGDLVYEFATQTDHPSYGYQIVHGATSLSEWWDGHTRAGGGNSLNHAMLGHIQEWFYRDLAGLDSGAPGWSELRIRPVVPDGLGRASARIDTVRGEAASSWRRIGQGVLLRVTVPANATATVHVPVSEGEAVRAATPTDAIDHVGSEEGYEIYSVGSGSYTFEVGPVGR